MDESIRSFLANNAPVEFERRETGWTLLEEVQLFSGRLVVCDPSLYPSGLRVDAPAGNYEATATLFGYDGRFYVSRFRVLCGRCRPDGAAQVGEVSIEFGRMTVGDDESIAKAGASMTLADVDRFAESLKSGSVAGLTRWGTYSSPYVECGTFGGSIYAVTQLRASGRAVGIEVDLLGEDRNQLKLA